LLFIVIFIITPCGEKAN